MSINDKIKGRQVNRVLLTVGLVTLVLLALGLTMYLFNRPQAKEVKQQTNLQPTNIDTWKGQIAPEKLWRTRQNQEQRKLKDQLHANKKINDQQAEQLKELMKQTNTLSNAVAESQRLKEEQRLNEVNGYTGKPKEEKEKQLSNYVIKLNSKPRKNAKHYIPAGAFASGVLLATADGATGKTAMKQARPMLVRITDPGFLPRGFRSDIKDCHLLVDCYGDRATKRVYGRLITLTCVDRKTGDIIETDVSGYLVGHDGKAGIAGKLVIPNASHAGAAMFGSAIEGISGGYMDSQQEKPSLFGMGSVTKSLKEKAQMAGVGALRGAGNMITQYFLDEAKSMQPYVDIAPAQHVDVVFTKGAFFGVTQEQEEEKANGK